MQVKTFKKIRLLQQKISNMGYKKAKYIYNAPNDKRWFHIQMKTE